MKRFTSFTTACALAVLAVLASDLRAQDPNVNRRTFMTFSNTVELPGVSLEPGTYEFRLADNQQQNVVQVLRKDDSKVIGQWTYVPAERERTTDDTLMMFKETPEGSTPAVQYWYYPGEKIGKEFIYPKDQAQRIAARTGQTVRSIEGPVTVTAAAAATTAPAESSAPTDSLTGNRGVDTRPTDTTARADASAQAASAEPRPVGTSGVADAAPAQDRDTSSQNQQARQTELPKTASPLPLSALIGLTSLVGAIGLRLMRA